VGTIRYSFAAALLVMTGMLGIGGGLAVASAPPKAKPTELWSCTNRAVLKPRVFTITCADGYILLSATHWTRWSPTVAEGTTTFAMNLCVPYCAASKMSYFPRSSVRLFAPVSTSHGRLFSRLAVTYKLHGKTKAFTFSWSGDPSFTKGLR